MRKLLIAGNWKMYKTNAEALAFVQTFRQLITPAHLEDVDVALCAPFPALADVVRAVQGSAITVGAQDIFWETEGAFTGEVSAKMLASIGARYVVIGHSERRQHFHETDETVNRKVKAAITAGLHPIVCIGETLQERDSNRTVAVLERQLTHGLAGIGEHRFAELTIAYEPVWAIGTGRTATPAQADEAHKMIRRWVSERRVTLWPERQRKRSWAGAAQTSSCCLTSDTSGRIISSAGLP